METQERVAKVRKVKGELPTFAKKMPEHYTNLVRIIKNNAEIRRFTALGILNWLTQKGIINGTKKYVTFKWNKFVVTTDGWSREFSYKEPFFINCLVASFSCFANTATAIIEDFVIKEITKKDEINNDAATNIAKAIKDNTTFPVEGEHDTTVSDSNSDSNSDSDDEHKNDE